MYGMDDTVEMLLRKVDCSRRSKVGKHDQKAENAEEVEHGLCCVGVYKGNSYISAEKVCRYRGGAVSPGICILLTFAHE